MAGPAYFNIPGTYQIFHISTWLKFAFSFSLNRPTGPMQSLSRNVVCVSLAHFAFFSFNVLFLPFTKVKSQIN